MTNVLPGVWINYCTQILSQIYTDIEAGAIPYNIKLLADMSGTDDAKGVLTRRKVYEVELTRNLGVVDGQAVPPIQTPLRQADPDQVYYGALILTACKMQLQTTLNPWILNIPINPSMPVFGPITTNTNFPVATIQQIATTNNSWKYGYINPASGEWREAVLTVRRRSIRLIEKQRIQFEFEYSNECSDEWYTLNGYRVAHIGGISTIYPNVTFTTEEQESTCEKAHYEGIYRPTVTDPLLYYGSVVQDINSGGCTRPYPIPPKWILPVNTAGVAFDPGIPYTERLAVISAVGPLVGKYSGAYIQTFVDTINKDEFFIPVMREGTLVDLRFVEKYTCLLEKIAVLPERFCDNAPWYQRLEVTMRIRYGKRLDPAGGEGDDKEWQGWRDLIPNVGNAHFVCSGDQSPIGGTYSQNEKLEVTMDSSGQPRQNTWLDQYGRDANLTYPGSVTDIRQFHMLYRKHLLAQFCTTNRLGTPSEGLPCIGYWFFPNKEEFLEALGPPLAGYTSANEDAISAKWDELMATRSAQVPE